MFRFIHRALQSAFRDLGQPVSPPTATSPAGDDDVLVGVRGAVPIYIGGAKRVTAQLRPIITRRPRDERPYPAEQGPRGPASERKHFEEVPGPPVKPKAVGRGLPVLGGPPQRTPYSSAPGEEDPTGAPEGRVRADRATGAAPYGLGPRQLTG
jgi:hypothetical protein